jgi:hypothetical protein
MSESSVPARKSARGSQIRGSLNLALEANSDARESPSRICEAVIDIRIATAQAKVR